MSYDEVWSVVYKRPRSVANLFPEEVVERSTAVDSELARLTSAVTFRTDRGQPQANTALLRQTVPKSIRIFIFVATELVHNGVARGVRDSFSKKQS